MAEQSAGGDHELITVAAALDIAHGAYEEAMAQQGMLPDAIKLIRVLAERNIEELGAIPDASGRRRAPRVTVSPPSPGGPSRPASSAESRNAVRHVSNTTPHSLGASR